MKNILTIRQSLGTIEIRLTPEAREVFEGFGLSALKGINQEAMDLGFDLGGFHTYSSGRIWFLNK
jgi:hypothetical protein